MAYLVRSFQTNARIRSLTTGTFNRVVKDRIAFRLSGANSVQANSHKCESDCPRNLTNIPRSQKPCQRMHPTEFPRDFHNGNSRRASARRAKRFHVGTAAIGCPVEQSSKGRSCSDARNGMAFRFKGTHFGARRSGRQKIEKRSYFWRSLP